MKIYIAPKNLVPTIKNAAEIGSSLGYNLTLQNGKIYNVNSRTITEGLGPCAKLTMWGGNNKFEAHIAPEQESLANLEIRISNIIEKLRAGLKDSYEEIQAFITGGIAYNPKNEVSCQSMGLLNGIYDVLREKYIPTTVIAAQRSDGLNTRMGTVSYNDKMYVYGEPIEKAIKSGKQDLTDAMEEEFDFVEISDEVPVKVIK